MKTYQKTTITTEPRLKIYHEDYSESPREWSNLGYFITVDRNYNSPDNMPTLISIVKETGEEAENQAEHMELIKKEFEAMGSDKIVKIYPVSKYEHSGVAYQLGTSHGFDYSNNGFYIITKQSQKEIGTKTKDFEKVIKDEINTFNKWLNGYVYGFTLYDKDGELEDSCGGFYDLEDIKEYLPKDYKDENLSDYLTD
jgi:hypothetical protein